MVKGDLSAFRVRSCDIADPTKSLPTRRLVIASVSHLGNTPAGFSCFKYTSISHPAFANWFAGRGKMQGGMTTKECVRRMSAGEPVPRLAITDNRVKEFLKVHAKYHVQDGCAVVVYLFGRPPHQFLYLQVSGDKQTVRSRSSISNTRRFRILLENDIDSALQMTSKMAISGP
uniref:Uncharacterized protein n=1 Tax=Anthracocystis walkeri TaxID=1134040 RepID=H2CZ54_9BASI|nr:hypothetical protein [Anthracocystis walkeri]